MRVTIDVHVADSKALKLVRQTLRQMTGVGDFTLTMEDEAGELWTASGQGAVHETPTPQEGGEYRPGDLVRISTSDSFCMEYDGREGVVTYGPDNDLGWLVSSVVGLMRCDASELTMVTPREER